MSKKRVDPERKQEILNAIHEHLTIEGPRNWDPLIERLGISRATLYRYIEEVKGIAGSDNSPGLLRLAQKNIKRVVRDIEEAKEEATRHLPAIPSPNIVAAKGDRAMVNIDFMTRLEGLYQDAEMVREHAVTKNPDGTEKIRNPAVFINSIKQRRDLLETALKAMQEVYDLNKIQDMHRVILEVVGQAAPDIQHEIILKLRELNNRYGITVEAKL